MKKINFIFGFNKSIFFVIPFLITSCGINLKATDGSKINFKRENVSCKFDDYWFDRRVTLTKGVEISGIVKKDIWLKAKFFNCTANGVRTYLNGYRENFNANTVLGYNTRNCRIFLKNAKGNWNWSDKLFGTAKNSFICNAASKLKQDCIQVGGRLMEKTNLGCTPMIPPDLSWDDYSDSRNFYYYPITPRTPKILPSYK